MKLNNIRITNYRCFKEADIAFDDHITLIVGKNGAGKTAILDAVAVAVSTFLLGIDGGVSRGISKDDRMAVLNPMLGEKVLEETPGVILIDEIDLHLHPQWQQTIISDLISIFPKIQFIVSSHAPAVINSVSREQIRILDNGEIYIPAAQTYGRDANSILREVMKVSERPMRIAELLKAFYVFMDNKQYDEADKVLSEIEDVVGTTDPDIAAARTALDLEKILGE